jgi:hypothetical protein
MRREWHARSPFQTASCKGAASERLRHALLAGRQASSAAERSDRFRNGRGGIRELRPAFGALAALYEALAGPHPDWDDYFRAMVDDRRLLCQAHVEHTYAGGA